MCVCVAVTATKRFERYFNEILHTDCWAQNLDRIQKWVKSLKPLQNGGSFTYLKNDITFLIVYILFILQNENLKCYQTDDFCKF